MVRSDAKRHCMLQHLLAGVCWNLTKLQWNKQVPAGKGEFVAGRKMVADKRPNEIRSILATKWSCLRILIWCQRFCVCVLLAFVRENKQWQLKTMWEYCTIREPWKAHNIEIIYFQQRIKWLLWLCHGVILIDRPCYSIIYNIISILRVSELSLYPLVFWQDDEQ